MTNPEVRAFILECIPGDPGERLVKALERGDTSSPSWNDVCDSLGDYIHDGPIVWSGHRYDPSDPENGDKHFGIEISGWPGAYSVFEVERDRVEYFRTIEDALYEVENGENSENPVEETFRAPTPKTGRAVKGKAKKKL